MKQKLKNYLKLGIFLFGISVMVFSCLNDDVTLYQTQVQTKVSKFPKITAFKFPTDSIFKANKILSEKIKTKFSDKSNQNYNYKTSEEYGFSIDTSYVQIIASADFESFSFIVERTNPNVNILENYVLTIYTNGYYSQKLVTYPIIVSENGIEYDVSNLTLENINDDSLLNRETCDYPYQEIYNFDPDAGECVDFPCLPPTGNGQHMPGDTCSATGNDRAYTQCNGAWVVTGCYTDGSTTSSGNGSGSGNGSYNNNTNNTPPPDEEVLPFVPLTRGELVNNCNKINSALNILNNQISYRQELSQLATEVDDVNNEKGKFLDENGDVFNLTPGPVININTNPASKYRVVSHTHNDDPEGKYSIFSFVDIRTVANILKNNKIDTETFVATLSTSKGTHYAFTINDETKFKDFFYYFTNDGSGSIANIDKWRNSLNKSQKLEYLYYNSPNPQISKTDDDNNNVLLKFLYFMQQADMGIALFETDATFENFQSISIDSTSVNGFKKTPCPN